MPAEDTSTSPSALDVNKLLRELEIPFSPDHVQWRVTNTTIDKKRGQVVPYADGVVLGETPRFRLPGSCKPLQIA